MENSVDFDLGAVRCVSSLTDLYFSGVRTFMILIFQALLKIVCYSLCDLELVVYVRALRNVPSV